MADITDLTKDLEKLSLEKKPESPVVAPETAAVPEADVTSSGFDRTIPSFAPFVDDPQFLALEFHSPIALVNNNFLQTEEAKDNYASIKARAEKWCTGSGVTEEKVAAMREKYLAHVKAFVSQPEPEFERIFIRDGERSFNTPVRRVALCHMLTFLQATTLDNDYHQGLSMIVSFLCLFLETPKVLCMIIEANTNARFFPGIWKSQSLVAATDGYIFETLIAKVFPAVHTKFTRSGIIPTLYIAKWWCSMGIHVLPFQTLAVLFDRFWGEKGSLANFELGLLIIGAFEEEIIAAKAVDRVLEYLRFDPAIVTPAEINKVVYLIDADAAEAARPFRAAVAEAIESLGSTEDLRTLREATYDAKLRKGVERAEQDFAKEEKIPDCGREDCDDAEEKGEYYCLDCKKHFCDSCAYSDWGTHSRMGHTIRYNEDLEDEDLE